MSVFALSLPLATKLVQQVQDERSRAAEETKQNSDVQISFKFAFKGVKPPSEENCLDGLSDIFLEVVNTSTNVYQSYIEATAIPVHGAINSNGDQVFQVIGLNLNSAKFSHASNSNYILLKGPFHLTAKFCIDQQKTQITNDSLCNINLKDGQIYDFSEYPILPGDINEDGVINGIDYSNLKLSLNSGDDIFCGKNNDLNIDGSVNSIDGNLLKNHFSQQEDESFISNQEEEFQDEPDVNTLTETPISTEIPSPTPTGQINTIISTPTSAPTKSPTITFIPTTTQYPTQTPSLTKNPTSTLSPTKTPSTTPSQVPTVTSDNNSLKIAVMADIHNNTTGLKRMMQKTKDRGSSFVVLAGDLSEDGIKKELTAIKKTADSTGIKYAAVPGNHDERRTYYDDVFGKKYQVIRFDSYKVKLILINASYFKGLGSSQKKWLETEMPECNQITCMVIMHMPLNHPTKNNIWGKYKNSSVNKKDAVWLKKMIVDNNIKKIVVGHIHQVSNYSLEGFETQIVSPIKGSKPVYGEFTFNNGQINTAIVSDSTN